MVATTTNYGYNKPAVNDATDEDLWGGYLNDNFDLIDEDLDDLVADIATAATSGRLPVGSIYINKSVSTNPGTLLGYGTWVAIEDMFLLAKGSTYTAGTTGGAATHTLAETNLPSNLTVSVGTGDSGVGNFLRTSDANNQGSKSIAFSSVGSGTAVTHLPPYIVVYVWERTA